VPPEYHIPVARYSIDNKGIWVPGPNGTLTAQMLEEQRRETGRPSA
jgi:hypothetical protein